MHPEDRPDPIAVNLTPSDFPSTAPPATFNSSARLPSRGLPVAQADSAAFDNDIDLSLLWTASSNGFTPLEQQQTLQAQAQAQVQAEMLGLS
ncbi:hypothetical protein EW146_g6985 [Bondarzewia mesenterica]|uniref:Uncharacterized protein n=1 Tax=Bondarzewia mesenterica TaxID=1095465 RepID=A0A4S4LMS7_9AGAM|nr:hypothetical protein EW146_g6985 [Bondarzewia mesenterica]